MFRNFFVFTLLHILGLAIFLMKFNGSLGAVAENSIAKRDAANMDCATIGPVNNVCIMLTPMPDQTAVRATLLVGDRQIVSTMLSGRNPPPFPCVPIVYPIQTAACLQVREIQLARGGFQACPEVALVNYAAVRFRCIMASPQGVSFQTATAPNTNGGLVEINL